MLGTMIRVRQVRGTLAILASIAVMTTLALGIGGATGHDRIQKPRLDTIHKPDYIGQTIGGIKTPILVRVKTKRGKRRYARIEGRDFAVFCDDGAFEEVHFGPVKARFLTRRLFQYQSYLASESGQSFFQVRGRIFPGREVITGKVLYLKDPRDPPGSANERECGSQREFKATATRSR